MQWFAQAPSNIALIKYMGKQENGINLPINPSLSYSLDHLLSSVELESIPGKKDYWEPLQIPGTQAMLLGQAEQARYLDHLQRLKSYFEYPGAFIVRSSNNFPRSSGLASSASSFAALTKVACIALSEMTGAALPSINEQANLSRLGSGSSCRSFFTAWAFWEGDQVKAIELPFKDLLHQAVIISHEEKAVSSRQAHERVRSSPFYATRVQEANQNLKTLLDAFNNQDWQEAYRICWHEFQGMHQLFATAHPPFSYLNDACVEVLDAVQDLWQSKGDGPIVTMDAGPNIHLLYRPEQSDLMQAFTKEQLVNRYDFI